jgi:hypothetical protein
MQVAAIVTFARDPEDGSHPRAWPIARAELWTAYGWDASSALDEVEANGGIAFAMIRAQLDEREKYPGVVLSVQLTIASVIDAQGIAA